MHSTIANWLLSSLQIQSTDCPVCQLEEEDVCHLLFRCSQEVLQRVCRWWEIDFQNWLSFSDWDVWFFSIRLPGKVKSLLEGVFYVAWWSGGNIRDVVKQRVQSLRRIFDGAFGGVGDEEVVVGEGVVRLSSSFVRSTNSCFGGMMVSLIFLKPWEEKALVESMVERFKEDEDEKNSGKDDIFN
ncbi:hypothetical protein Tco_0786755 [Tanacetum coccineum]